MTVDEILDDIIRKEGGFVNHPKDYGGATNMGITQATLSQYYGRRASVDEVRSITVSQAKEIYERRYYADPRLDILPKALQPIAVDTAVLFGPRKAIMFLQSIVNQAGFGPVDEDGVMGPNTRNAIEQAYAEMKGYLINAVVEERIDFHRNRVAEDPSQNVFLQGWINRAESFRTRV